MDLTDPALLKAIAPLLEKAEQDAFDTMCSGANLIAEFGTEKILEISKCFVCYLKGCLCIFSWALKVE